MSDEHLEWLSNILALAERIANGSLNTNWSKECRDPALSLTILKVEVFETLLSDEARWTMRRQLMAFPPLVEALELYLHCLRNIKVSSSTDTEAKFSRFFSRRRGAVRTFWKSRTWQELLERALEVSATARDVGY